jgi:hypothetical protein
MMAKFSSTSYVWTYDEPGWNEIPWEMNNHKNDPKTPTSCFKAPRSYYLGISTLVWLYGR